MTDYVPLTTAQLASFDVPQATLDRNARECPLITLVGDSGQGKTHTAGTIFEGMDYWPVLFIEGDDGASTIAEYLGDERVCLHRNYSRHKRPGEDDFEWFLRELRAAETAKCGSIIVEGISRHYQAMVNEALADRPDAKGFALRALYLPAANRTAAMLGALQKTKRVRRKNGTGIPIIVTCNVKEETTKHASGDEVKWNMPALSPNKVRNWMELSDLFGEMRRDERGSELVVALEPPNLFRKCRSQVLTAELRGKRNPSIPWILTRWAEIEDAAKTQGSPVIEQLLANAAARKAAAINP